MIQRTLISGLAIVILGAGCWSGSDSTLSVTPSVEPTVEGNIVVTSPVNGATVSSPFELKGQARVFENTVNWRILDSNEKVVAEGYLTADAPDVGQYGDFSNRIFLPILTDAKFTLEVFDYSAKDGSIENKVSRSLTWSGSGKSSVSIFFIDSEVVAGGDCNATVTEKRTVAKTVNVAELALRELLKGPTTGSTTEIPPYTSLKSVVIADGLATVDFNSYEPAWSGGSCHVSLIRDQIEKTLLQFPTVESVEILVNGKGEADGILQP